MKATRAVWYASHEGSSTGPHATQQAALEAALDKRRTTTEESAYANVVVWPEYVEVEDAKG